MVGSKALRSGVIVPVIRLITIIFAYYNRKNNPYNHFVKPYQNFGWLAKTWEFFNEFQLLALLMANWPLELIISAYFCYIPPIFVICHLFLLELNCLLLLKLTIIMAINCFIIIVNFRNRLIRP